MYWKRKALSGQEFCGKWHAQREMVIVIGIYDWERQIRQKVVFDIHMATDIRKAAATDEIEDTLNYKAVAKRIIQYVEDSKFQLVETLAERVAEIILNEFQVPWVKVILNKQGAVRGSRGVGVIIERGKRQGA